MEKAKSPCGMGPPTVHFSAGEVATVYHCPRSPRSLALFKVPLGVFNLHPFIGLPHDRRIGYRVGPGFRSLRFHAETG
jgi:hypothetical protein